MVTYLIENLDKLINSERTIYIQAKNRAYNNVLIDIMSKKRSKGEAKSQGEQASNQKKEQIFYCKCGKQYGSRAAVHTHIKTKHPNEMRQYKIAIQSPNKTGQVPSIRLKDIVYNQHQTDLMCTADKTLKNISDFMKRQNIKAQDFLIDQDAIDSCQELDNDSDQNDIGRIPCPKVKRDHQINQLVEDLKQQYQIEQIDNMLQSPQQFRILKLGKFKLSLIKQLIKYFNLQYAARIHLQLQIIAVRGRNKNIKLQEKLTAVQKQMWGSRVFIVKQLQSYYQRWVSIQKKQQKRQLQINQ